MLASLALAISEKEKPADRGSNPRRPVMEKRNRIARTCYAVKDYLVSGGAYVLKRWEGFGNCLEDCFDDFAFWLFARGKDD